MSSAETTVPPKAPAKPVEAPLPTGFDQAVKTFKEGKYAIATKQFEGFIKSGAKNEEIHDYLAQCYYKSKMYSKAIKEFDWVANNGKHSISLRNQAAENARTLKCYMAGVCSGNCLKANDPRWQDSPGHPGKWIKFPLDPRIWGTDAHYISAEHIGHVVTLYKGDPRVGDICPICRGSGRLRVLKDGAPL